jgi:hypothetical protein
VVGAERPRGERGAGEAVKRRKGDEEERCIGRSGGVQTVVTKCSRGARVRRNIWQTGRSRLASADEPCRIPLRASYGSSHGQLAVD